MKSISSSPTDAHRATGVLAAFTAAAAWAFLGLLYGRARAGGTSAAQIVVWASLITCLGLVFLIVALPANRRPTVRVAKALRSRSQLLLLTLAAVFLAAENVLFVSAFYHADTSIVLFVFFLWPLVVALLNAVFRRERLPLLVWLAVACASAGVVLTVARSNVSLKGVGLALLAGLAYAGYTTINGRAGSDVPPVWRSLYFNASVVFAVTLFAAAIGDPLRLVPSGDPLLPVMIIAAIAVCASPLFLLAIDRLGSTTASIIQTNEALLTAIIGWIFLHEQLVWSQWLGGALIVVSACLAIRFGPKRPDVEPPTSVSTDVV